MQGINSRFPTRETSVPRLGDGVVLLDVMCLHLRWNFHSCLGVDLALDFKA
jgi:hypothetical protein